MTNVLIKLPRMIVQKLVDLTADDNCPDLTTDETVVLYAAFRDALASKPLEQRGTPE